MKNNYKKNFEFPLKIYRQESLMSSDETISLKVRRSAMKLLSISVLVLIMIHSLQGQSDPTVSGLPTDLEFTEDTIGDLDLSDSTFDDPDTSGAINVILEVDSGTLNASLGDGVTIFGDGTVKITLVGTVNDINSFLDNPMALRYTGDLNAEGDDIAILYVKANDKEGSGEVDLETVNLDIVAVNDAAAIGGDISGAVTEDAATTLEDTGLLSITDVDGTEEESFLAGTYQGTYGQIDLLADGNWTYTVDNGLEAIQDLQDDDTLEDVITVESFDGTEQDITITINTMNNATIGGDIKGNVIEDDTDGSGDLVDIGLLIVSDPEGAGEESFQAATYLGTYGDLELQIDGNWTYTAVNDQEGIQRIVRGEFVEDIIKIQSIDGSDQDIRITIFGANETSDVSIVDISEINTVTEDIWGPIDFTGFDLPGVDDEHIIELSVGFESDEGWIYAHDMSDEKLVDLDNNYDDQRIYTQNLILTGAKADVINYILNESIDYRTARDDDRDNVMTITVTDPDNGDSASKIYDMEVVSTDDFPVMDFYKERTIDILVENSGFWTSVAALSNGNFVYTGTTNGVKAKIFDTNGTVIADLPDISITGAVSAVHSLGEDGFIISWWEGTQGSGFNLFAKKYDNSGIMTKDTFPINRTAGTSASKIVWFYNGQASFARFNNGGYIFTYRNNGKVWGQRFNDDDSYDGDEFIINNLTEDTVPAENARVEIKVLEGDGFVITYTVGGQNKAYFRVYDHEGNPIGDEARLPIDGWQTFPNVELLENNRFALIWTTDRSATDPVPANNKDEWEQHGAYGGNGGWGYKDDIYGLIYAYDFNIGTVVQEDDIFMVNTSGLSTYGWQRYADTAPLANGGFVVTFGNNSTWRDTQDHKDVRARIFDRSGNPVGIDFKFSQFEYNGFNSPEYQLNSDIVVAGLTGGGIVAFWEDDQNSNISFRVFDGPPVDLEGTEDTPINMGALDFTITDVDNTVINIMLQVENGALSVPGDSGVTISNNETALVTLNGTPEAISDLLKEGGIGYTPNENVFGENADSFKIVGEKGDDHTTQNLTLGIIYIDLEGTPDPAEIDGDITGEIFESDTPDIFGNYNTEGELSISDPDGEAEESFQAGLYFGTYGAIVLDNEGNWTYSVSDKHLVFDTLDFGESVEDEITIRSVDGTIQVIIITINGDNEAGLGDSVIEGFKIFPNPVTNGNLTISTSSAVTKSAIIYNLLGERMYSNTYSGIRTTINLSQLSTGIYILKVIEGNNAITQRLIIK
jgi:VCBS repeat-containing protein